MREYTYKYDGDIFTLCLSDIQTRFGDEGIYQKVILVVKDPTEPKGVFVTLFKSEWGIESFIESLTNDGNELLSAIQYNNGQISYICKRDEDNAIFKRMNSTESTSFLKWLFYCKLPLVEQRKLKLKQWKEKQLA